MGSEDFEACDCVRTLRLRTSGISFQGQGQYTIRTLLFFLGGLPWPGAYRIIRVSSSVTP